MVPESLGGVLGPREDRVRPAVLAGLCVLLGAHPAVQGAYSSTSARVFWFLNGPAVASGILSHGLSGPEEFPRLTGRLTSPPAVQSPEGAGVLVCTSCHGRDGQQRDIPENRPRRHSQVTRTRLWRHLEGVSFHYDREKRLPSLEA